MYVYIVCIYCMYCIYLYIYTNINNIYIYDYGIYIYNILRERHTHDRFHIFTISSVITMLALPLLFT